MIKFTWGHLLSNSETWTHRVNGDIGLAKRVLLSSDRPVFKNIKWWVILALQVHFISLWKESQHQLWRLETEMWVRNWDERWRYRGICVSRHLRNTEAAKKPSGPGAWFYKLSSAGKPWRANRQGGRKVLLWGRQKRSSQCVVCAAVVGLRGFQWWVSVLRFIYKPLIENVL